MPATTPWFVGGQVPLTWTNTDTAGNPQDAATLTSVSVTVYQPDGTTKVITSMSTPALTHAGAGTYEAIFTATQAGHHAFTWASTDSTYPGAFGDSFEVQSLPDSTIVSLAEAKEILHLQSTSQFDAIVQGYNAAATNWIEYVCGPVIVKTITETLDAFGMTTVLTRPPWLAWVPWTVVPADLQALGIVLPSPPSPMIRVQVYGIEYPASQLYCDPERGLVSQTSRLPFFYGAYRWQYSAGRPIIPAGIYEAAKIVLEHLFMVERGGVGALTAGESEETTMTGFGFAVPNRAVSLLLPYSAATRMVAA